MFTELTDIIKESVVVHLSNSPRFTQFLPAERIYSQQVPANPSYPFFRLGTPIPTPYVASCFTGTSCRLTLDLFAHGTPEDGSGEAQVGRLARLLVEAMDDLKPVSGIALVDNTFLGASFNSINTESDLWRGMLEFNVTAVIAAT